jgi:hypothetical protein
VPEMRKREEADPIEKPLVHRKRRMTATLLPTLAVLCLLACPIRKTLSVPCCTQTKVPAEANKIRFRISDSESDRALPDARIHIVYRSDKESSTVKEEIDVKSDKMRACRNTKAEGRKARRHRQREELPRVLAVGSVRQV